ncbi:MAG: two-component system, NtrC family, response regulator GlrR [Verrucomicrobiota bacterium]
MLDATLSAEAVPRPIILIVDDEVTLVEIFKMALSGRFEVRGTTSPEEALRLCIGEEVKLVLTDFRMNEMNGLELIKNIHALHPALPCILFSGALTPSVWAAALNCGCRHVLRKPISLRTVIDLCARLLTPEEQPTLPPQRLDTLESIPWQGGLGRALQTLANHLLSNRNLVYLASSGGPLPVELLQGMIPALTLCSPSASPPVGRQPLYTDSIQNLDAESQTWLAAHLGARRSRIWLLSGIATPDELLDQNILIESLYYRLVQAVIYVPSPGDCPSDTVELCAWWLAGRQPADSFTDEGQSWLESQAATFDWPTMIAVISQALRQNPDVPLDASALQRANLSLRLKIDLSRIAGYPEYSAAYARDFRQAWEMLRSAGSPTQ